MVKKNIYWLIGDRYLCIERKNKILNNLQKKEKYSVELLDGIKNADDFCSKMSKSSLFGPKKTIYVYDGDVPEPKKTVDFITSIEESKVLILITEKVNKKSDFYQKLKENIEEFPTFSGFGFIDKKTAKSIESQIRKTLSWDGDIDVLRYILEVCNYNTGVVISEIEKIKTFNNGQYPKNFNEIIGILCSDSNPHIDSLIDAINDNNIPEALRITRPIVESKDFYSAWPSVLGAILENQQFQLYCKMAEENGAKTSKEIGEFVSEHWHKKGKTVNAVKISSRYVFNQDRLSRVNIEQICNKIQQIHKAMSRCISQKQTPRFIFHSMIVAFSYA